MRCPYCNGINTERARFCVQCGRDMRAATGQPVSRQQPPTTVQGYPPTTQSRQQAYTPPMQPQPQQTPRVRQQAIPFGLPTPAASPAPEAPVPFPPHTMAQLQALEQGALSYTVMDTVMQAGRKKLVRITYPKCVPWQQVATLLKAFKEQQESRFESVIIQGYPPQDTGLYAYTNGQLTFDRDVRLGSQVQNRYVIETGNGFESDSVRIVLSE